MGSDGDAQGHLQEFSPTSYETAMEALSSLITRRRRGDGSNRGGKFHLMSRYMKVSAITFMLEWEQPLCFLLINLFSLIVDRNFM